MKLSFQLFLRKTEIQLQLSALNRISGHESVKTKIKTELTVLLWRNEIGIG